MLTDNILKAIDYEIARLTKVRKMLTTKPPTSWEVPESVRRKMSAAKRKWWAERKAKQRRSATGD